MITVSNDFKTAMKSPTRELYATVTNGLDVIAHDDDLKSIKISTSSGLLRSVMRQCEIKYLGSHSMLGNNVLPAIGVQLTPEISTTIDTFTGDELDTDVWNTFGAGVSVDDGLIIAVNGASPEYTGILSDNTIDLTGSSVLVQGVNVGNTAITSWEVYPLKLYLDDNNYFEFVVAGGNIIIRYKVGGSTTTIDTIAYSDEVGFRIRELDGTIYYDTSDGTEWTNIGDVSTPFVITALRIDVLAGMWQTEASNTSLTVESVTQFTPLTSEFIEYGSFIITSEETNQVTGETTAKGFDLMYLANEQYSLTPTYPIDLMDLVTAICTELGWTLNTTSFPNDDLVIASELFSESKLTYRQILDQIAEASGSTIYFSGDDELHFRQVEVSTLNETLGLADMFSIKLEPKYTDINQLVGSRMPQEDNILVKDDANIALNGIKELRIVNNYLIDSDRETYLPIIFAELLGLNFYPCEAKTVGLGYFEIGDRISVPDSAGTGHETVVMEYEILMDGALKETLKCFSPDKTYTNLNYAGVVGQIIKDTQIIVNKQTGEIQLLVTTTDGLTSIVLDPDGILQTVANTVDTQQEQITELEQTVETLELLVSGTGGTNLLKNSVGLKGDLEEWISDTDVRNDGTIINTTDVQNNSESGSAIEIEDEYIVQTVNTIVGELYTLYFRYRTNGNLTVNITGMEEATLGDSDDEWLVYKVQTPATLADTIIRLESATGVTAQITDITFKLGDVNGWIQAPNEVYGSNFKFDKDGFEITSLTDTFKSLLDNTKLAVYDTSSGDKIMMLVSKDSGKITNLVAQDELTIQRYENSSSSLRFIPVDDGAYIVIND